MEIVRIGEHHTLWTALVAHLRRVGQAVWALDDDDQPVAGVGQRDDFYAAYQAAGGATVDLDAIRFWEAFGNLRWGVTCIMQAKTYIDGHSPSVELASIGRRIAETEWELLNLMEAES